MFSRRVLLYAAAAMPLVLAGCNQQPAQKTADLFVQSDGDFLSFQPNELSAPAGAHIRLTFHHAGTIISQDHNWVLVMPGTVAAVDQEGEKTNGLLPKDDPRIIALTPMIGKGETITIEFDAPPPGTYPFFCSTPGHAVTMRGVLHIIAGNNQKGTTP
jgi:azurin